MLQRVLCLKTTQAAHAGVELPSNLPMIPMVPIHLHRRQKLRSMDTRFIKIPLAAASLPHGFICYRRTSRGWCGWCCCGARLDHLQSMRLLGLRQLASAKNGRCAHVVGRVNPKHLWLDVGYWYFLSGSLMRQHERGGRFERGLEMGLNKTDVKPGETQFGRGGFCQADQIG